jgi:hypothetical protein
LTSEVLVRIVDPTGMLVAVLHMEVRMVRSAGMRESSKQLPHMDVPMLRAQGCAGAATWTYLCAVLKAACGGKHFGPR